MNIIMNENYKNSKAHCFDIRIILLFNQIEHILHLKDVGNYFTQYTLSILRKGLNTTHAQFTHKKEKRLFIPAKLYQITITTPPNSMYVQV